MLFKTLVINKLVFVTLSDDDSARQCLDLQHVLHGSLKCLLNCLTWKLKSHLRQLIQI